jgi:DMSO/TMAO reductase YedYZ molybdopterin-dependent catalytic subunit
MRPILKRLRLPLRSLRINNPRIKHAASGDTTLNTRFRQAAENPQDLSRRSLLKIASGLTVSGFIGATAFPVFAETLIRLPVENGLRRVVRFPEKGEMILLRTRPPLLETPLAVFDDGVFTPNDRFFVRWHLPIIPTSIDVNTFRLRIHGHVNRPIEITLDEVLKNFDPIELAAVNQCSGNGRAFFSPRVPGGEWGNGAMGNAMWTGFPLKSLLEKAGIRNGAVQVRFNGLDSGEVPATPDFLKSLSVEHAMDGQVMVAYGMNGSQLPLLNGFPLRLVVPGWFSTYWVKMLSDIEVLNKPDENFWMSTAYRIPDTPGGIMKPGEKDVRMVPIDRMLPRSFLTNLKDGDKIHVGAQTKVRGIAFGGDAGLKEVAFSSDGGANWKSAMLGEDHGAFSFRQWHADFAANKPGRRTLMVKATNRNGITQPARAGWNPGGYMRNVVEQITVRVL